MAVATTDQVLKYVNNIRTTKLNMPPLKALKRGNPSDAYGCAISASLSTPARFLASTSYHHIEVRGRTNRDVVFQTPTPKYMHGWLRKFDNEKIPELVRSAYNDN